MGHAVSSTVCEIVLGVHGKLLQAAGSVKGTVRKWVDVTKHGNGGREWTAVFKW